MNPALRISFLVAIALMVGGNVALGSRNHALQAQGGVEATSR